MGVLRVSSVPIREAISSFRGEGLFLDRSWIVWFATLFDWTKANTPDVSADNGNASVTVTPRVSAPTQIFNTPITADRTVTLSTTGVYTGCKFRVTRTAAATGAFNVSVGGLKNLTAGTWCDVEYNGSAWMLTAAGSL